MKTLLILLSALLFVSTGAQAKKKAAPETPPPLSRFSLGAYMSYWNMSEIDELDFSGALGGGAIGQVQINPYLALEMRISAFLTGEDEDVYIEGEGWYENDLTISALPLEIGITGFLPIGEIFSLYGGPGVGYYFFDGQFTSTQGPVEITRDLHLDNKAGFYLVFGTRAQLARNTVLFADAKYTWVESTASQAAGVFETETDLDFSGLALEAGLIFTF